MIELIQLRRKVDSLLIEHSHVSRRVREERLALKTARQHLADILSAQKLVQTAAEQVQTSAHSRIANVVSHCLNAVFGEDAYGFKINFSKKRGKTEAELCFTLKGKELDPTTASGGGAVDVAAFALRLACLTLSTPRRRKLLVADEPWKFVNGEVYQERVGQLLMELSKDMNIQMLIVSDDDWLKIGKVVEL